MIKEYLSHKEVKVNDITFTIKQLSSTNISNCYNKYSYSITADKNFDETDIIKLRESGYLGYGQWYDIVLYTQTIPRSARLDDYVDSSD